VRRQIPLPADAEARMRECLLDVGWGKKFEMVGRAEEVETIMGLRDEWYRYRKGEYIEQAILPQCEALQRQLPAINQQLARRWDVENERWAR
jgi:hypothetical protein